MAEKRMLSKKVLDTDAFLDMPLSAQALYFHLAINADDEGFIGNPKRIRDYIGAGEDDLALLIEKRFVISLPKSANSFKRNQSRICLHFSTFSFAPKEIIKTWRFSATSMLSRLTFAMPLKSSSCFAVFL